MTLVSATVACSRLVLNEWWSLAPLQCSFCSVSGTFQGPLNPKICVLPLPTYFDTLAFQRAALDSMS